MQVASTNVLVEATCTGWTVAQVFQHAVGGQIGYAAALTGEPCPDFVRAGRSGPRLGHRRSDGPAVATHAQVGPPPSSRSAGRSSSRCPRGTYVVALASDQGDDDVAVLLRYLGRDPCWSTS
ncbi:hypothetical protein [Streptomyces purpurascens]|uniref:hypothetical protein n=1 Tax=Streptomyces purpurascens TaxID=1924 RepID=UPI003C2E2F7A